MSKPQGHVGVGVPTWIVTTTPAPLDGVQSAACFGSATVVDSQQASVLSRQKP